MKALLINPQEDWKSDRGLKVMTNRTYNDHLGIRYIASMLEQNGHEADLIDAHFEMLTTEMVYKAVAAKKYDFYGISIVEPIIEDSIKLAGYIKEINPEGKVFIGGYGATLLGHRILRDCSAIDGAILGEGELTVSEIMDCLAGGRDWRAVHGIMYIRDGEVVRTTARKLIEDINTLPLPKRGPADKYNGKANIIASRGCYGQCRFCSIAEFYSRMDGKRIRIRRAKLVVDEMEYLHKQYGVHHFDFVDDNFTVTCLVDKNWAEEFVSEMQNRNMNVTWGIQARANDIDEELFRLLYKGGLRIVSTGIENDVDRVMQLFNTGTSKQIHRRAVEAFRKLNLHWWVEMIMLEPTASLEEISENLDFLDEINITDNYRQNPVTFYPRLKLYHGTPISNKLKESAAADVYEEGYHIKYHFRDPRVEKLDKLINTWQQKTVDVINLHNTYLHYEASQQGKLALSLRAVKLSKQYLNMDMRFMRDAIDFVGKNEHFTEEQENQLFDRYEEQISFLYNELTAIKEKLSM